MVKIYTQTEYSRKFNISPQRLRHYLPKLKTLGEKTQVIIDCTYNDNLMKELMDSPFNHKKNGKKETK